MRLVLISGLSGSGKSIALNVLEDAGYYCVDNLPAALLPQLIKHLRGEDIASVAVAVDMRGGTGIAALPQQLRELEASAVELRFLFLDARDSVLIQRYSETRRRHPLGGEGTTLAEAIAREREALETIATIGHRVDTSDLRPSALRCFIKDFAALEAQAGITLLFESFGYKHGLPLDADLVFDVRCLPNPHYDPALRQLTGLAPEVAAFLESQAETAQMAEDVRRFIADWLPAYIRDSRAYLTVAIGCTGGQHRSVYFSEWLAARFRSQFQVLVRHRALA